MRSAPRPWCSDHSMIESWLSILWRGHGCGSSCRPWYSQWSDGSRCSREGLRSCLSCSRTWYQGWYSSDEGRAVGSGRHKTHRCRSCASLRKYKHALDQGFGFLHIIFETTGQMHHETLPFFVTCLEQASRVRQIPFNVLWKYWMSTLMFTLQRSMAQGIIGRSSEIYGGRFKETYETSRGAVRDFAYMNIM